MKRLINILSVVGLCACMVFLTNCNAHEKRREIRFGELEKIRPFTATVDFLKFMDLPDSKLHLQGVCLIGIRKTNGEELFIGDPLALGQEAQETAAFGHTLKLGATYEFPTVWLAYIRTAKRTTNPDT